MTANKRQQRKQWKRQYRRSRKGAITRQAIKAAQSIANGQLLIEDENGDGFVYVVDIGMDNLYKIGHTVNVHARMKALMAANPKISLIAAIKAKSRKALEKALHAEFGEFRTQGELFKLGETQLNRLLSLFPVTDIANKKTLRVTPEKKKDTNACIQCGTGFEAAKTYWRLCPSCANAAFSGNKTKGGFARWRNLRTETYATNTQVFKAGEAKH